MSFTGIADPETVAILRNVVDRHCRDNFITDDLEREQVAIRVVALFFSGTTEPEDLFKALENWDHRSAA